MEASYGDWEHKLIATLWAYQQVAYKTLIGTTPFNMVFGLDSILSMKFLIPTLRVAQELKWTGHQLSDCIEDLEQLDETCLKTIEGMYVEKRRQKRWHDCNLHTKKFHKGTLVLFYTL